MFLLLPAYAGRIEYSANIPNACGDIDTLYAIMDPIQYTCGSGNFLPANTLGCATCPAGYTCTGGTYGFNETDAQGLTRTAAPILQNVNDACAANIPHRIRAVFTLNSYNCNVGYYLPADATGCVACLTGHTCVGGTYTFNETTDQGIEINTYTCDAGYYLPANNDGCVICSADSYCTGGTYQYSETETQGIGACGSGLYSPAGMSNANQCGHILHVGDAAVYLHGTKKTSPAVHVKIGNDIFYGNMTTADVVMHAGSAHKLKVNFGGQTYSIYDDTVNPNE